MGIYDESLEAIAWDKNIIIKKNKRLISSDQLIISPAFIKTESLCVKEILSLI